VACEDFLHFVWVSGKKDRERASAPGLSLQVRLGFEDIQVDGRTFIADQTQFCPKGSGLAGEAL
jgi:hypothetical protein